MSVLKHVLFYAAILLSLPLAGADADKSDAICYEIQNYLNGITDFANFCYPTKGRAGKGSSFLVISSRSVMRNDKSKRAWMIFAVGAVGKSLNDRRSFKADEIWFGDADIAKEGLAYALSANDAKKLQSAVAGDRINLQQFYDALSKKLIVKTVPIPK